MTESLKHAARQQLDAVVLNGEELAALNAQLQPVTKRKFNPLVWVAGAILLLGLGLMAHTQWLKAERNALVAAIATEAVDLHTARAPLEVTGDSIVLLSQVLEQLDFTLVETWVIPDLAEQLTGARHCTLQGRTGAELRLGEDSLFQLPYTDAHEKLLDNINVDDTPIIQFARGYEVTLWEERGLLMALVKTPNTGDEAPAIAPPALAGPTPTEPTPTTPELTAPTGQ